MNVSETIYSINFIFSFLTVIAALGDPVVKTKYGTIIGSNFNISAGRTIEFFTGIPFAKPPVGELRFEEPQPPDPWKTPLVAKSFEKMCVQFVPIPGINLNATEDCLFVNIARPSIRSPDSEGYPVLVWMYGGGFIGGSSQLYHNFDANDRIVSRGIILVSFNYRLGPFGFFATENNSALGNYGLWDQVQALKFINEVIPSFGGNPKRITIFGASAGGGSVSWMTYIPSAQELFQKVIPMCGCAHVSWAQNDKINYRSSLDLLNKTNCLEHQNPKECLRTKSVDEISAAENAGTMGISDSVYFGKWGPRINEDIANSTDFVEINKNLDYLYALNTQEDITLGINSGFLSKTALYFPIQPENAPSFNKSDFEAGIKFILSENGAFGSKAPEAIQKIIDFYENQTRQYSRNQYLQSYIQLFSDLHFNVPLLREVREKTKHGKNNVYVYVNDYVALKFRNPFVDGSAHCMDVPYIFGNLFNTEDLTDQTYVKTRDRMLEAFESFVKSGTPKTGEITFRKVENGKIPFTYITSDISLKEDLWPERVEFWNQIMEEFGFDWVTAKSTKKVQN
ncbi:hypothetical protein FO519_009258 [Halicephalobus sp. NKZ332]|nr:hypothetical protein FO519_009258 [Halicephalobus sp. NKZ332]